MRESALWTTAQGRLRAGWRALLFVLLFAVLAPAAQLALRPLAAVSVDSATIRGQTVGWLATLLALLAAHAAMLFLLDRRAGGWAYVDLGRRAATPARVATGVVLGALAIGVPCALLLALGWLTVSRGPVVRESVGHEALVVIILLVPAALAEELLVRGYLLSALADGMGRVAALVTTSAAFGLLHFNNPSMTPWALVVVALAGLFLGAVRFATTSLYAAWGAHFAWNAVLAVGLHALLSGSEMARVRWRTMDSGPDWATGGAWGPEGGAAAALGLALATTLLIARRPRAVAADNVSARTHA